jgi:hypothetical protein
MKSNMNIDYASIVSCLTFRNKLVSYGKELLAPRHTPKVEDNPLSAVRDWLFNIFSTAVHIWSPPPFVENI